MAIQLLTLAIVACETSAAEVKEIISGCQIKTIGGTVNTKYRDYSGEDVLEELHDSGVSVQRAERLEDDGASMLNIEILVPDEQRTRLDKWIIDNHMNGESSGALQDYTWGVKVGDTVDVETFDGVLNIEFRGRVIGFKDVYAQVEDMDGDVFDVELEGITVSE
jgi:hypothetical protein